MPPKDAYVNAMVHLIQQMNAKVIALQERAENDKNIAREQFSADMESLRMMCKQGGLARSAAMAPTTNTTDRAHCPNWPDPSQLY